MKEPEIKIPRSLFLKLAKYHTADIRSPELEKEIAKEIEDKIKKIIRHDNYTDYVTAATPEEQAAAYIKYLEER